ncbi:MAG TPA: CRTAC1 family protein [Verrucomicrobiae bacterium]|nr:CRTAC1 family protein [Verrucomicrobiae bacterium]
MFRRIIFVPFALAVAAGLPGWSTQAAESSGVEVAGARWFPLDVPAGGRAGFTLLSPNQTGVTFTNLLGEYASASNRVLLNGSGLAAGDYDNDGWPDLFLCGLDTPNRLYRNLGNWKFKDVTAEAGVQCPGRYFRGAVFADLNGDGALDLLVATTGQGVLCFLNDGHGKFSDVTAYARTGSRHGSMTLTLADVDGNGTLDLYVANNRTEDIRDRGQVELHLVNGQLAVPPELQDRLTVVNGQVLEYGEPDQLYLNDGKGRFTPVSWTGGRFRTEEGGPLLQPPLDWGLTASFRDLNDDGFPDLYVCNDFWTPDRIWLNDGKGRFRAAPRLALRNMSASSMGVDFADIDRDGFLDFFVVDMLSREPRLRKRQKAAQPAVATPIGSIDDRPQFMRNTLYLNRGDQTFAEIANFAGVAASEWSWSPVFLDVDLDGYEDLLITTGHAKDVQDLDALAEIKSRQHSWNGITDAQVRQQSFTRELMEHMRLYPPLHTPIVAFHNRGGLRFEEVTASWGTDQPGVHHAIALADFDRDGDLDLAVNNLGSPVGLYRNNSDARRVAVKLRGLPPNTQGIGAKVSLLGGAVPRQRQEVICGGRYLAGADPMLVFAAGNTNTNMTIAVLWRSGRRSEIKDVAPNRRYEIFEPAEAPPPLTNSPPAHPANVSPPLFADVSSSLPHRHYEEAYDDFTRQPLLPWRLSQAGPGIAWFDLDGDGVDELFIGAGRGGSPAIYRVVSNERGVEFSPWSGSTPVRLPDDSAGLAGWVTGSGRRVLLAGLTGWENAEAPPVLRIELGGGGNGAPTISPLLPGGMAGCSAVAVADYDGDGDLDVFVGGSAVTGRYPEARPSRLYRANGDALEPEAGLAALLAKAGLVNGAVWSDLDGDGYAELVITCEWGPLRVFGFRQGQWREETAERGLDRFTGWWRGVTAGDIDGDGRLDLVAANWGLNSPYQASPAQPLVLYYGDFGERGAVDLIETEYDPITRKLAPRRMLDALAMTMPFLRERAASYKTYSESTVATLWGDRLARGHQLEVTTLASTVFFNRGGRFEAVPLPREAQFAPAFGVNVGDFDLDGHEDVLLTQNFFATQPETPRLDAGRGLVLLGNAAGRLDPIPSNVSGLQIDGEQRGAALSDFDRDGRLDLIVTQNGAATRLFRNTSPRRGLRVRLEGPRGNPDGIGAVIRARVGAHWGPAREIHGGSGYWSQDSATQILSATPPPEEIEVRWPGGKRTRTPVARGATEIRISLAGDVVP